MKKKLGFLLKAGPWLCLLFSFCLSSCSVLKPGNTRAVNEKTYRLTMVMLPGNDGNIFAALDAARICWVSRTSLAQISFVEESEQIALLIRINSDAQLEAVLTQMQSAGIMIKGMTLQNN